MTVWRIPFDHASTAQLLNALRVTESREHRARAERGIMELLVDRFKDLKIEIYANEHPPPHFHVKTSVGSASFKISDCSLVDGDHFLSRHAKEIQIWHTQNKQALIEVWNKTRPGDCPVGEYRE